MFDLGPNINNIGHPCQPFKSSPKTREAGLGSGIRFSDETTGMREIGANNAGQIERWWKSVSHEYWTMVRERFYLMTYVTESARREGFHPETVQGLVFMHQVRLRHGK